MSNILWMFKEVLKPCRYKVLFFIVFAFIWVAGVTQTYAFVDDVPGLEKPLLYDYLKPFGFWFARVVFSAPLYLTAALACLPYDFCTALLHVFPNMDGIKLPLSGIAYSYLAAAFFIHVWRNYIKKEKREKHIILVSILFTTILTGPSFIILPNPELILFITSSYATLYLVSLFYTASTYGVYKITRSLILQKY